MEDKENSKIHSDSYLLWNLLKELFFYLLFLIPIIFLLTWYFVTNSEKKSEYFSKVFLEPFKLIQQILSWIFESKHTVVLILILFSSYLLQILLLPDFGDSFATNPIHLFSFQFYTLITSIILHGSLVHLLSNSLALFIFGRIVERHIGSQIYILFFLGGVLANIFSHLFSYLLGDFFTSWGASGAIATIVLLAILLQPFAFVGIIFPIVLLGWSVIYGDLIGVFREDTINQFAHLGGYFATFLLFAVVERNHVDKMKKGLLVNVVGIILLMVVLYLI